MSTIWRRTVLLPCLVLVALCLYFCPNILIPAVQISTASAQTANPPADPGDDGPFLARAYLQTRACNEL